MGSQLDVVGTAAGENTEQAVGNRVVDGNVEKRMNWTSVVPTVGVEQVDVEPTDAVAAENTG